MPVIKNALLRYRIIDRCLKNAYNPFPSKEDFRRACEEEMYGSSHGDHICDSTIEKDLFAMRMEHDAPIKYSKLEKGYYYEDEDYSLDEIPLTDGDVEAIKIAANILDQFKNTDMFKQFGFAIDKILDRVNISQNVQDEAIDNYVQFETVTKVGGSEHLEAMLKAIKARKKIQFKHQSFTSDSAKVRRIHPYLLKEYRNRWYLIGRSEVQGEIRTFGLDRVTEVTELHDSFTVESGFNPEHFFEYSVGITASGGKPQKVVIETDELLSKYLTTQPLHHSQVLVNSKDGKHTFEYFLLPSYELKMLLLGHGSALKVIEPKSLQDEIREVCENVTKQYS